MDPDSFGSVDPDPRYELKGKAEFNQHFFFLAGNYICKSEPKKVAKL